MPVFSEQERLKSQHTTVEVLEAEHNFNDDPPPIVSANIISLVTWSWMNSFLKRGKSTILTMNSFWGLQEADKAETQFTRICKEWDKEVLKGAEASLNSALYRTYKCQFIVLHFLVFLDTCLKAFQGVHTHALLCLSIRIRWVVPTEFSACCVC